MTVQTEQIWNSFSMHLRSFILKRVPESHAEDILQDVFLKIHLNREKLRDYEQINRWIFRVTRNVIIDYYRSRKAESTLPETHLKVAEEIMPDSDDVRYELSQCLKFMVDGLPEKYRHAIVATEFQGWTQKELGENLDISLSGAKSRVQRAKEKLKDMLMACCEIELDRRGSVITYSSKICDCGGCI